MKSRGLEEGKGKTRARRSRKDKENDEYLARLDDAFNYGLEA